MHSSGKISWTACRLMASLGRPNTTQVASFCARVWAQHLHATGAVVAHAGQEDAQHVAPRALGADIQDSQMRGRDKVTLRSEGQRLVQTDYEVTGLSTANAASLLACLHVSHPERTR